MPLVSEKTRTEIGISKVSQPLREAVIRVYEEPGNELDEADLYWGRIAIQD